MANPFKKPISKVSVKTLLSASTEDIGHMTTKESEMYAKRLQKVVKSRLKTIEKYGKISQAAERYLPDGEAPEMPEFSGDLRKYRNKLQHNIAMMKTFLEAKSSTLTGIRQFEKETAQRIFGANTRGEPLYKFSSTEEANRFWSAYHEFMHQYPVWENMRYGSERVQQFLGRMTFWRSRSYTAEDFGVLISNLINNDRGRFDIRAEAGHGTND